MKQEEVKEKYRMTNILKKEFKYEEGKQSAGKK